MFTLLDESLENLLWLQNGCCAVECTLPIVINCLVCVLH